MNTKVLDQEESSPYIVSCEICLAHDGTSHFCHISGRSQLQFFKQCSAKRGFARGGGSDNVNGAHLHVLSSIDDSLLISRLRSLNRFSLRLFVMSDERGQLL